MDITREELEYLLEIKVKYEAVVGAFKNLDRYDFHKVFGLITGEISHEEAESLKVRIKEMSKCKQEENE